MKFSMEVTANNENQLSELIWHLNEMGCNIGPINPILDEEAHAFRSAPRGRRRWSEAEDEILRESITRSPLLIDWNKRELPGLANRLDRTKSAVSTRRHYLAREDAS